MSHDARRLVIRSASKPYELHYFSAPGRRGDWRSNGLAYDRLDLALDRRDRLNADLRPSAKAEGGHWEVIEFKTSLMREDVTRRLTKKGGYYAD